MASTLRGPNLRKEVAPDLRGSAVRGEKHRRFLQGSQSHGGTTRLLGEDLDHATGVAPAP